MNRAILIAVALLAAAWLVVDMTPKAVRLVDAHSECGVWTGHCPERRSRVPEAVLRRLEKDL